MDDRRVGFVLPMAVGAMLMSQSTVVVALNARLLRRIDLRPETLSAQSGDRRPVARVAYRVAAGGHSVPEEKIRQRHRRLWGLVAVVMARADAAAVYDNSSNEGPRIVAQAAGGVAV